MPIYMKYDGIEGDATARGHEKWIELQSFSWGASNARGNGGGGGGGAGRTDISDISVSKSTDKASPKLFLHCCQGKHIPTAVIEMTRGGGEEEVSVLRYELKNVFITSFSVVGSMGDPVPTESLSLNFTKITYTQYRQDPTGAVVGETVFWDLATNRGG